MATSRASSGAAEPLANYELVKDLGSGNFGVARLMRDKRTGQAIAIKFIERGDKVCCCGSICSRSAFLESTLAVNPALFLASIMRRLTAMVSFTDGSWGGSVLWVN